MAINTTKRIEQLQDFLTKGNWVWALYDDLGIKKEGTVTNKYNTVMSNLKDDGDEGVLKELMSKVTSAVIPEVSDAVEVGAVTTAKRYFEGKEHKMARKIFASGLNLYFFGPAGCGKTSFARKLSGTGNYVLFSCSNDARPGNLIGHFELINDETKFVEGPLIRSMKEGRVLILDEFDRVSEDVASKLHEVLEAGELLIEATNELVECKEGFRVIATGNSDMQGSMEYNTNALDLASIDRFEFVPFNYSNQEHAILLQEGMPDKEASSLMDLTSIIRKGQYTIPFSTRRLISIAKLRIAGFDLKEAVEIGFASRLPEDEAKQVRNLQKTIGQKADVWSFKEDTPKDVIEKVAKQLSPSEASIFKSTLTCIVSDKMASLSSDTSVRKWLAEEIKDQAGVSQEQFTEEE
jgi:MoxR-like ATPase